MGQSPAGFTHERLSGTEIQAHVCMLMHAFYIWATHMDSPSKVSSHTENITQVWTEQNMQEGGYITQRNKVVFLYLQHVKDDGEKIPSAVFTSISTVNAF